LEIPEEGIRHIVVVVLAGVHQNRFYIVAVFAVMGANGLHERGYFHEVGACGGNENPFF